MVNLTHIRSIVRVSMTTAFVASLVVGCSDSKSTGFQETDNVARIGGNGASAGDSIGVRPDSLDNEAVSPSASSDPVSASIDVKVGAEDEGKAADGSQAAPPKDSAAEGDKVAEDGNTDTSSGEQAPADQDDSKGAKNREALKKVIAEPSGDELGQCAKKFGKDLGQIKIAGNESDEQVIIRPGEVFAVKVTGNQSKLNLVIAQSEYVNQFDGVCLFVAGNQSELNVKIFAQTENIYLFARGNKTKTNIAVQNPYTLANLTANVHGHDQTLTKSGNITNFVEE